MSFNDNFKASCKYALAALNASFITHILHPLDVIKIRFQSFSENHFSSLFIYVLYRP